MHGAMATGLPVPESRMPWNREQWITVRCTHCNMELQPGDDACEVRDEIYCSADCVVKAYGGHSGVLTFSGEVVVEF